MVGRCGMFACYVGWPIKKNKLMETHLNGVMSVMIETDEGDKDANFN